MPILCSKNVKSDMKSGREYYKSYMKFYDKKWRNSWEHFDYANGRLFFLIPHVLLLIMDSPLLQAFPLLAVNGA